ncbi:glycine zipper 2TM domain-containing protein [Azohydromonas caseinilytica]|uniref:Glycine zipper 2TM domain-containing protein n=1 Tax=Azohydromonas caseinilytica TaxID=2728836 RepID=A0A848F8V5_9BURK|nr:glycine zipper 2TM domain-containing protein [Azohydromonas caseinilytica]NML15668.1 glycine zipper 2TM domain-containing protein [Azohydromonas caseinilytica]
MRKTPQRRGALTAATLLAALLASGCASMDRCDRNTAVGAAVGGVAGSVLTDQSTLGTVGGAVAGGVLGRGRGC